MEGEVQEMWGGKHFEGALLAIHSFNKIVELLTRTQTEDNQFSQLSRLKFYGLNLFRVYIQNFLDENSAIERNDLYAFVGGYNQVFKKAAAIINATLKETYKEILSGEKGTAFSLPRDQMVWDLAQAHFQKNCEIYRDFEEASA